MFAPKRREKRIPIRIAFRMEGVTDSGTVLRSDVVTENISKSGLSFSTGRSLPISPGTVVNGRFVNDHLDMIWNLRVVWQSENAIGGELTAAPDIWFVR